MQLLNRIDGTCDNCLQNHSELTPIVIPDSLTGEYCQDCLQSLLAEYIGQGGFNGPQDNGDNNTGFETEIIG